MYIKNSFILSVVFILISGFILLATPETGNAQPLSNCCIPNGGTGCDTLVCQVAVCDIDPFCCNVEWDGLCAAEAIDLCEVCQGGCCTGLGAFPNACEMLTEQQCIDSGGTFQGAGTECLSITQCFARPIPTMNEWGMIGAAGILGLIAIVYLLARKRRALS